ncbi:glycosyltransferase family 4 protein [Roseomonas sp. OT10]|uniref:glycosyltransferase family 4 protein n=1 Tax=Roseomonas cutis TaxID=2897332 RepID=UPI001E536E34|nr:glycosyltransferase family 4 protein [Roseomonas sp. OT10]UFN50705.1 glycosyltransferase family 4 protein [Roseomonas sp. OT10]
MTAPPAYDVFADLSGAESEATDPAAHLRRLMREGELSLVAGQVRLALPPGRTLPPELAAHAAPGADPAEAFHAALMAAARRGRFLLVLTGPIIPPSAVVPRLLRALAADPMFGSSQPRLAAAATDLVHPLPARGALAAPEPETSRGALSRLPEHLITAELPAACMLLRPELAEIVSLPAGLASGAGALAYALCQARRCGFRNVVANRTVVASTLGPEQAYPLPPPSEAALLAAAYPDSRRAAAQNADLPQRRFEALLSAGFPPAGERRRLLLDCHGLSPVFNGTALCTLGLLDGMAALDTGWQIDVLSTPEAARFHELKRRYPGFGHRHGPILDRYAAALTPNQPFDLAPVKALHRHALVIAFNILDTIGWDALYPLPDRTGAVWRLIARHADGLAFISGYSRDRFRTRFPLSPGVAQAVAHLSLKQEEQSLAAFRDLPEGEHVLLFGNSYDHKALALTLSVLTQAFPFQRLVVLGGEAEPTPFVQAIPSGQADSEEVHRLIATARAIVFPSFYEGFGLPVVEGLAYGRPVIVRRSPIWEEIAGHARLPGRLIPFGDPASLVDALGRVLEGMPVAALPQGVRLDAGAPVTGWRESAALLLELLDRGLAGVSAERWLHRDDVLRG